MSEPTTDRPGTRSSRSRIRYLAIAICLVAWSSGQADRPVRGAERRPAARIESDIAFLADDARQGRGVGTEGLDQAADFIARRMKKLGLKTDLVDGGPFQTLASSARV
ncbi:MAG: hypothetical protein ACYC6Y_21055, partial [Thermoguttaceae bacterium]